MFRKRQTLFKKRLPNFLISLLLLGSNAGFALAPFISAPKVAAANEISASDHEGQLKTAGVLGGYSNGNIKTYTELESVNFRFTVDSSAAASGTIEVIYGSGNGSCAFFQSPFNLGTHDSSASAVVPVSGSTPTVTPVGAPTADGEEWVQVLNVSFAGSGKAVINYYVSLTDTAGDCSGSSTHTQFGDTSGGFKNTGAQAVSIPANDIIELAKITVTKYVDTNGDGVQDRTATTGEWNFSLNGGTSVGTDANGQVIFEHLQTGDYTITESGPEGFNFLSVSGDDCVSGNVSGTAVASVVAAPTADDATCDFYNGVAPGKIKIVKNALPNNLTDFHFTANGTGVTDFTLDDDSGVTGADNTYPNEKQFSSLTVGDYVFTEDSVTGWDLTAISCPGADVTKDLVNRKVTVHLDAGDDVTCTFENRQRGQIIVTKQTLPDGDTTEFPVTISETGAIHSTVTQNVTDDNSVTYTVGHGTYDANETVPSGWSVDEDDCQDLDINGNTPLVNGVPTLSCTITNTKLAKLTIIKDALPNHSQDFEFSVLNLAGGNFFLDDDADNTLSNQKVYDNLTPGQAYSVTEQPTPGWSLTNLICGGETQQGSTASVTPEPGEEITCTFTNTKLVSISGTKYTADADSSLGPVLSGWTIFIDSNNNGELDGGEVLDVTDGSGNYSFDNILYGTTVVLREVLMTGWTQIFGPDSFTVDTAENITDKDFGNFENGSIGGFKWNDKNANDVVDQDEEKLSDWTITLYDDENNVLHTDITDGSGNYSFTNLAPGDYSVCETQQTGWVQTYPNSNACHYIEIDESGETNEANFGNQGRGSITVYKNVDTDGDGDVDDYDVNTWAWDIAGGEQNTATGSSQNVAAGTYTISEDQKDDYHVTDLTCEGQSYGAVESGEVTVGPGDNITCTFTNTRDTGTIEVRKEIAPENDNGLFDLQIDGVTEKEDASDGDTTGAVQVVTGSYDVSEIAGDSTDLSDYSSSLTCTRNGQPLFTDVSTTDSDNFEVDKDDAVVCTFTNVRYGHIVVEKQTQPDGSNQNFDFIASYDGDGFSLSDGQQNDSGNLLPGDYSVAETVPYGWDLDGAVCDDQSDPTAISLQAGETVTCVFTNIQRGSISGTKYEVDAGETDGTNGTPLQGWTIFIDANDNGELNLGEEYISTDIFGAYNFDNLEPGDYVICEVEQSGWTRIFPAVNNCLDVTVSPGETDSNNDFGNFKNGRIEGYKFNDHDGEGDEDTEDEHLEDWYVNLYDSSWYFVDYTVTDQDGNYSFEDLAPGTYKVCESSEYGWVQTYPGTTFPDTCYSIEINTSDETNNAVFGNQGRGQITILKDVDMNGDGDTNDQEDIVGATDWTWDINGDYFADQDVATGDGRDVPAGVYTVNEDQKNPDFEFVSVECELDEEREQEFSLLSVNTISVDQAEQFNLTVNPGDDITCTFTNKKKPVRLELEKTNNRPEPTVNGDIVTYKLEVSVPHGSGTVYNTVVTDLPPENFEFVPGSQTASTTNPGHDIALDVGAGPNYASPGTWILGTLIPGETVTLTYRAVITDIVSPGTYPDLAFAEGRDVSTARVLSNQTYAGEGDPFDGTEVTIQGEVLGAVLVNTGNRWMALQFVVPMLVILGVLSLESRQKKGASL